MTVFLFLYCKIFLFLFCCFLFLFHFSILDIKLHKFFLELSFKTDEKRWFKPKNVGRFFLFSSWWFGSFSLLTYQCFVIKSILTPQFSKNKNSTNICFKFINRFWFIFELKLFKSHEQKLDYDSRKTYHKLKVWGN